MLQYNRETHDVIRGGSSRGRAAMTVWRIAGALIMVVAVSHPASAAPNRGISAEVEKVLAETSCERPPSLPEKQRLVELLQRRGVETLTDLHPYLGRSETVRHNALIAIGHMGNIDARTLEVIQEVARAAKDSPAPSVAVAVRLALDNSTWPAALDFGLSIAPQVSWRPLLEIMAWISAQDQASIAASKQAVFLTRVCLHRMASLFETGDYSGNQPLGCSMAVERLPFSDRAYAEDVTRAFLTAIRNAGRMKDTEEIGMISSFMVVAREAEGAPELVEDGLMDIVTTGPEPLVKLVLWRMSIDGFAATKSGQRIVAEALKNSPALASYLDQLRSASKGASGTGNGLRNEIDKAFRDLRSATQG